jgi:hypothetical protein
MDDSKMADGVRGLYIPRYSKPVLLIMPTTSGVETLILLTEIALPVLSGL